MQKHSWRVHVTSVPGSALRSGTLREREREREREMDRAALVDEDLLQGNMRLCQDR